MIAITFDLDWCPDEFLADTLIILDDAKVKATFFATHKTPLLEDTEHEVGIHPNFLDCTISDYGHELDRLMNLYPQSKGVRAHSYFENFYLLDRYKEIGLEYDTSLLIFKYEICPFCHWNGLIRYPVYWEDMVNCRCPDPYGDDWTPLIFDDVDGLYVFNFHPTAIALNLDTMERWQSAKKFYYPKPDVAKLREFANPEESVNGSRVFLKKLLTHKGFVKLGDLA